MQINHPNFFLIGAPKSGTTALSEYLRFHPNVFFCPIKEPEYYATDLQNRIVSTKETYEKLFQNADPSRETAIGEGSTFYFFSTDAVKNILVDYPRAKFIVIIRNPTDLVISHHAQMLVSGNENLESLFDAWNAEEDRRNGKRIPVSCRNTFHLYYSQWGKLGTQLQRLMDTIPADQLKIIVFDEFIHNTRKVYQDVLGFLAVPDDGRTHFPKVNPRRKPKNQFIQNIFGWLMHVWVPLRIRIFKGKSPGIGNYIRHKITQSVEPKNTPEDVYLMLKRYFEDEVILLEKLLGVDLAKWH